MKHPRITVTPCRTGILPVSIIMPTPATAIRAIPVATVPNSVPWNHATAATNALDPCASANEGAVVNAASRSIDGIAICFPYGSASGFGKNRSTFRSSIASRQCPILMDGRSPPDLDFETLDRPLNR
jgi:hypothetical protein